MGGHPSREIGVQGSTRRLRIQEGGEGDLRNQKEGDAQSSPLSLFSLPSLSKFTPFGDFPGGAVVKNPPANAGDMGSSPGPGRSHMPWSN